MNDQRRDGQAERRHRYWVDAVRGDGGNAEIFPRQKDKRGGWTINPNFLQKIERRLERMSSDGVMHNICWEDIELVLLAVEAEAEAEKENT